ncbi:MAG TPA: Na-translocating system protein MpsC family protein [Solirubrobacteraceae bacterium]|nr:Na-translocating system protein MpsC family protein [Solirubrobacteraceae bacterium]
MRIVPHRDGDGPVDGAEARSISSSPLLEISNATVRLYKAAFGRGPTHARARFAGNDTLVVLLQDTMTVSERKLAALGEHERLRAHRLLLHKVVEDEIRSVIERILQRPTLSLISGLDTHRDVAAEVVVLAPALDLSLDGPFPGSAGGAGSTGAPPIA